jgi:hypothetical protein
LHLALDDANTTGAHPLADGVLAAVNVFPAALTSYSWPN